jgi:hypothetical protein
MPVRATYSSPPPRGNTLSILSMETNDMTKPLMK